MTILGALGQQGSRSSTVADKIVVIGSLNMDLVGCAPRIPVVGETLVGHTYFSEPGGKGANQAYAAAKLGGHVAMLGRVGSDDFGRQMRANLEQVGCDVSGLLLVPNCTSGIALIFVADDGHNSIIIIPGANDRFSPEDVDASATSLKDAAWVLLQLENPLPTVLGAARAARRAGARVILDPAPARPLPEELLELSDIITPNETEAAILADLPPSRLDPDQALGIARKLQDRKAGTVVVKLGDQGCLLVTQDGSQLLPAPPVKAVDTTAAGDEFNAGLAVGLSEGLDLAAACRFANAAAALSVTRLGAQASAPTRSELDAFAA
ncbi:MAG TPA: ribokinase [Terriglobia bacterium]